MSAVIAWSVTYLVHSTILIVAAALAARLIRSAAVRDVIWKVALLGGIVTASLQTAMPERTLPRIDRRESLSISTVAIERVLTPSVNVGSGLQSVAAAPQRRSLPEQLRAFVPTALALLWVGAFALLAVRLIAGAYRFRRSIAGREELYDGEERRLLDELRAATGCERAVRLTASDAIGSPVATMHWEIVIPRTLFARLTVEQRRSILAHELAHLMRRDPAWLAATELLKALFVIQPLNWLAQRALKQTAEFICDDAAVAQTGDRRALVETLAELASSMTGSMPSNVAAMAEGGSNLMARVVRVLRCGSPDRPMKLVMRIALATAAIALTVIFAPGVTSHLSAEAAEPRHETAPRQPVTVAHAAVPVALHSVQAPTVTVVAPRPAKKKTSDIDARIKEATMAHSFDGPDGKTHVRLDARDVELKADGSHIRFTTRRGYLRGHERSARGPRREIEILPGADGEPLRRYRVNGASQAWNAEANRVIHAAFVKAEAYERPPRVAADSRPPATAAASEGKLRTWSTTHELTIDTDGVRSNVLIESTGVKYDQATGQVYFDGSARVYVQESSEGKTRRFTRDANATLYEGRFDEPAEEWLTRILTKHTALPRAMIASLAR